MSNKIHVSQIDTGILPGKIPVYEESGVLKLITNPIDQLDAVTKQYVDSVLLALDSDIKIYVDLKYTDVYNAVIEYILSTQKPTILTKVQILNNINVKCSEFFNNDGIHREKFEQALDYATHSYPVNLEHYPLIQIDASFNNTTPTIAADTIIEKRKLWLSTIAQLESLRLSTKKLVEQSDDIDYINNIFNKFIDDIYKLYQIVC